MNRIIETLAEKLFQQQGLERLRAILRISSISPDLKFQERLLNAHADLVEYCTKLGLKVQSFDMQNSQGEGSFPLIVASDRSAGTNAKTVVIYGHYDVQPTGDPSTWQSPPFEPEVRVEDGIEYIFGRGTTDNKGQFWSHLEALRAFRESGDPLPVNLVFILEGQEEIGSPGLIAWLEDQANRDLVHGDVVVISDTSMAGVDLPAIDVGLRGHVAVKVTVHGPENGVHSGSFGGAVTDPAVWLGSQIGLFADSDCFVRLVQEQVPDWLLNLAKTCGLDEAALCLRAKVSALDKRGETLKNALWLKPSFSVTGLHSGHDQTASLNAIPPWAFARLSVRLGWGMDPQETLKFIVEKLRDECPPSLKLEIEEERCFPAFYMNPTDPAFQLMNQAMQATFGNPVEFKLNGASIPAAELFSRHLGVPVILAGLGYPGGRLHEPNERHPLSQIWKGAEMAVRFWFALAA
ncbi:M20/M25/M40 family metallo-hydrolase [bacterium]|nr:M20/M25/M40 family metallo-hydrolase [bacterium]